MAGKRTTQTEREQPSKATLQQALQRVSLAAGQTIVVARGPQLLAHKGALKLTEAQTVASQVAEGWQERGQSARIQFMRLPMLVDESLLYTQPLGDDLFLTVIDSDGSGLPQVIGLARQVLPLLESAGLPDRSDSR